MKKIKGRGTGTNVSGRFNHHQVYEDLSELPADEIESFHKVKTEFLKDSSRTILSKNNSPDLPFTYSINPYRGCEHGCAYCYARPTHEYFGLSAGLDFESKILVKEEAPELLREKLMSPGYKPATIFISGVTDCYQPAEFKFQLTRRCLEVLLEFRNPVFVITKNALITRDIDIYSEMAKLNLVKVFLSVTSLDSKLARQLEPRTSAPQARIESIKKLSDAGVPVGVNLAPLIPGLTDHEIPALLKACREAGATTAGYVPIRLPHSVKEIFSAWLETHYPDRKDKVLNAIRSIRGGELNDPNFGTRMRGQGPIADQMSQIFDLFSKKYGYTQSHRPLTSDHFKRPGDQLDLF